MAKKKNGCLEGVFDMISILICLVLIGAFFTKLFDVNTFYRNRYPIVYKETVEKYCDLYGVDEYLVQAIIRTESFFNEKAVSKKGAIGLMQIMPETGSWVAEKLNLENFTTEDLLEPEKNIMIGVWYINYLSNKFNGNLDNVIAAYNAGPSNVSKWLSTEDTSSDGENLLDIPFSETKKYSEKVKTAYDMYLKIYNEVS